MFFNSRYGVFHGINTSYVTRRCYVPTLATPFSVHGLFSDITPNLGGHAVWHCAVLRLHQRYRQWANISPLPVTAQCHTACPPGGRRFSESCRCLQRIQKHEVFNPKVSLMLGKQRKQWLNIKLALF